MSQSPIGLISAEIGAICHILGHARVQLQAGTRARGESAGVTADRGRGEVSSREQVESAGVTAGGGSGDVLSVLLVCGLIHSSPKETQL